MGVSFPNISELSQQRKHRECISGVGNEVQHVSKEKLNGVGDCWSNCWRKFKGEVKWQKEKQRVMWQGREAGSESRVHSLVKEW